jgi:hypothetical protein
MNWKVIDSRDFTHNSIAKKPWHIARNAILKENRKTYLGSFCRIGDGAVSNLEQPVDRYACMMRFITARSLHVYPRHVRNRVKLKACFDFDDQTYSSNGLTIHNALRTLGFDSVFVHCYIGGTVVVESHSEKAYGIYRFNFVDKSRTISLIYHEHLAPKLHVPRIASRNTQFASRDDAIATYPQRDNMFQAKSGLRSSY